MLPHMYKFWPPIPAMYRANSTLTVLLSLFFSTVVSIDKHNTTVKLKHNSLLCWTSTILQTMIRNRNNFCHSQQTKLRNCYFVKPNPRAEQAVNVRCLPALVAPCTGPRTTSPVWPSTATENNGPPSASMSNYSSPTTTLKCPNDHL